MLLQRRIWSATTLIHKPQSCIRIQWQSFHSFRPLEEAQNPPPPPSALENAPRSYGKQVEEFTPIALDRPIGLPKPPKPGENAGIDNRTRGQKWNDWMDRDKNLEKRSKLISALSTPYFREWTNMRHHEGKSFLCPPRLFKAERALYFPNLRGQTIEKLSRQQCTKDTTLVLRNNISVVSIYSSQWGYEQSQTLTSKKNNLALHSVLDSNKDIAQFVEINVETDYLKGLLVDVFGTPRLRRRVGERNWGRYFVVRRSLEQEVRDAIGLLNSKVGYTYLLDAECRIRWACSGPASEEEKEGIVKGARRLIEEERAQRGTARRGREGGREFY